MFELSKAPHHTEAEWIQSFTDIEAFWKHDGNRLRPHAKLTPKDDGRDESNGFFNYGVVAQYPERERLLVGDLAHGLKHYLIGYPPIDRVVGPGSGAITLASRLAETISFLQGKECLTTFVDKASGALRVPLKPGERVLACEDTISSGGSVQRTIDVVEAGGGLVIPVIAAVCNRSGMEWVSNRCIVALITTPMVNWTPAECPLCAMGSTAIKPKQDGNWKLLTQSYRPTT